MNSICTSASILIRKTSNSNYIHKEGETLLLTSPRTSERGANRWALPTCGQVPQFRIHIVYIFVFHKHCWLWNNTWTIILFSNLWNGCYFDRVSGICDEYYHLVIACMHTCGQRIYKSSSYGRRNASRQINTIISNCSPCRKPHVVQTTE